MKALNQVSQLDINKSFLLLGIVIWQMPKISTELKNKTSVTKEDH